MGLTFVIRDFHNSVPFSRQNDWGAHFCNSPKGSVCHTKASLDADEEDPREQRDVLALRDLGVFRNESAPWNPHIGSVHDFVHLDSTSMT